MRAAGTFRWMVVAVAGLAMLILAPAAVAEDLYPPDYRGLPGSTCQEWDFMDGSPSPGMVYVYPEPDGTNGITFNPYGTATLMVDNQETAKGYYDPGMGPGDGGAWMDFDSMLVEVPNTGNWEPNTWKDLRIQITYWDPFQMYMPGVEVRCEMPCVLVNGFIEDLGDDWHLLVEDWFIEPNPQEEFVDIFGDSSLLPDSYAISEVVIDTICVPEPATLALLGLGAAALVARRRRRQA